MDPRRILRKFNKTDWIGFALTIICIIDVYILYDISSKYDVISGYGRMMDVNRLYEMSLVMAENMLIISASIIFKRVAHG